MDDRPRALLVDDDPDIRTIGAISLEAIGGWSVTVADGGTAGVEMARAERPDVIVLDMMMPDLDGLATLALLQDDPATRTIPVVFMTAKVQRHDLDVYLEAGAVGVIAKPFDPVTLAEQVGEIAFAPRPVES